MRSQGFNIVNGFYDPKIEKDFRHNYFHKLKYQIRFGFVISVFIYFVFYFIDKWVFPELEPALMINRIIVCCIFLLILSISFSRVFITYLQLFLLLFGIIATIGILWKLWYLNISGYDFSFFYTGLILTTSIVTFYLRIRFIYSVWLNLICILSYIALYVLFLEDKPVHSSISLAQTFVNSLFFITCSSFLSLYGAYYLEVITRKDFIVNKKLWNLNNNLDQLIHKRSIELEQEKQKNSSMLLKGQEKERERIAGDLHDSICNQLALLRHDLEMQAHSDDFSNIGRSIEATLKVSKDVRYLSKNQSAHVLRKYGLVTAMKELVNIYANEYHLSITLNFFGVSNELTELSDEVQINLYRSFQEGLQNVVKHAMASRVEVQLVYHEGSIDLTISDNGKGFSPNGKPSMGFGLENIKLRIEEQLKGKVTIDSNKGHGTNITMTVNLKQND